MPQNVLNGRHLTRLHLENSHNIGSFPCEREGLRSNRLRQSSTNVHHPGVKSAPPFIKLRTISPSLSPTNTERSSKPILKFNNSRNSTTIYTQTGSPVWAHTALIHLLPGSPVLGWCVVSPTTAYYLIGTAMFTEKSGNQQCSVMRTDN